LGAERAKRSLGPLDSSGSGKAALPQVVSFTIFTRATFLAHIYR